MYRFMPVLLAGLLAMAGSAKAADPMKVAVSILPQQFLLEQIGGDYVEVQVMIPPGASPHHFEPSTRQMAQLADAELYFSIGINFENSWMSRFIAANQDMTVIDSSKGIERRYMRAHEAHSHDHGHNHDHHHGESSHGHGHDHQHGGTDPHIWLSPVLMRIVAQNVRDALIEHRPEHAEQFRENFEQLAVEINQLDTEILAKLTPIPEQRRVFLVFHPAFGYFADAYGFRQIAIETEGKEPGPRTLAAIIDQVKERNIRTIFSEPQFPQQSANVIAREIDGNVETLDPLNPDWIEGMRAIASNIEQASINDR